MTRFWISIEDAVKFVAKSISSMDGGEIFIPKMKSMEILNCIKTILPNAKIIDIGIKPGEKIHEKLIHSETKNIYEFNNHYIILPEFKFWTKQKYKNLGKKIKGEFEYSSNTNKFWIKGEELARKVL